MQTLLAVVVLLLDGVAFGVDEAFVEYGFCNLLYLETLIIILLLLPVLLIKALRVHNDNALQCLLRARVRVSKDERVRGGARSQPRAATLVNVKQLVQIQVVFSSEYLC